MIRLRVEWPTLQLDQLKAGAPLRIGQHPYVLAGDGRVVESELEVVRGHDGRPAGGILYAVGWTIVELDLEPEPEEDSR